MVIVAAAQDFNGAKRALSPKSDYTKALSQSKIDRHYVCVFSLK